MTITSYSELSKNGKIVYSAWVRGTYTAAQVTSLVPAKITTDEAEFILSIPQV